nr:RecName: Full=20-alpha-hydroxysteroid dehydrogenase; Short=20-alpha-HSD [Tetrahymena pyriformis]AAB29552.1 20 alpha-hydroxysteroid dehydrogenase, 20 alpha HSD {N-terminal} {EC 1.1.1.149} [Tetrahymena pyriformis, W, Peptide Partial, 18 aa] [Tetrahymena pyriformis]
LAKTVPLNDGTNFPIFGG